jgi:hypothetical protein
LYLTKLDSTDLLKIAVGQISSEIEPKIINCTKVNKNSAEKKSKPSTTSDNIKNDFKTLSNTSQKMSKLSSSRDTDLNVKVESKRYQMSNIKKKSNTFSKNVSVFQQIKSNNVLSK